LIVTRRFLLLAVAALVVSPAIGTLRDPRYGHYTVQRIEEDAARDAVSLTTVRIRPVMPGKPAAPTRLTSAGPM